MLKTLKAFTNNKEQSTPFRSLFELIAQELKPDVQLLITCNHENDGFFIVSSTDEMLIGRHFQLDDTVNSKPEQSIFSQSTVFFNLNLTPKWPASAHSIAMWPSKSPHGTSLATINAQKVLPVLVAIA